VEKDSSKMKKLSILICSLNQRASYLERLKQCLKPQIETNDVEILVHIDNGELTIGEKRNKLLSEATGEYVAFVDDDDLVSDAYIDLVLNATKTNPDIIGMHLLMYVDTHLKGLTYHSLQYKEWFHRPNNYDKNLTHYFRNPNHLNPVKTSIARQIMYPAINMGEDRAYSMQLLKYLTENSCIESYIPEPIYYYLVRSYKEV
jgi:glycosyltransferase involved in cell wall biosynthesis